MKHKTFDKIALCIPLVAMVVLFGFGLRELYAQKSYRDGLERLRPVSKSVIDGCIDTGAYKFDDEYQVMGKLIMPTGKYIKKHQFICGNGKYYWIQK